MPLEFGGVVARAGFAFHDHVAAGFSTLLGSSDLVEVWCRP
jgi:hypothetical protein